MTTLTMVGGGCKKFLETPTANRVSLEDIFTNYEGARTTILGCYTQLRSSEYYQKDFYVYPELTGGNIKYAYTKSPDLTNVYNFSNQGTAQNDMYDFYVKAYSIIYSVNTIIENIDRVNNATQKQKNRIVADAYGIRALVNFDLVRVFAQSYFYTTDASHEGIVLKIKNDDRLNSPNDTGTVKLVYTQIIKDFDSAIARYANSTNIYTEGNSRTYLTFDACLALKARACLYAGQYASAYTISSNLIQNNKYPLITNQSYVASWSNKNISSESIFELAYGTSIGGSYGDFYNPYTSKSLYLQFATTNDLLQLFDGGDIRGKSSLFKDTVFDNKSYSFCKKYFGTSDSANNIKVIRASELYLIAAEAALLSDDVNGLSNAAIFLDAIRKRANPNAPYFSVTTKQEMLDEIFAERRRELCFEGHLFFDISRMKRNLIRIDCTSERKGFSYPNDNFRCPKPIF